MPTTTSMNISICCEVVVTIIQPSLDILNRITEIQHAKLPKGFHIPTPVGNYSPDWAVAFYEGSVKHIFFVAETKGSMENFDLRPSEKAKTDCAKSCSTECPIVRCGMML